MRRFNWILLVCLATQHLVWARSSAWEPPTSKCDVNADGSINISDVQLEIGESLGLSRPNNDLNTDGLVNVIDVQIVINAALNLGCAADTGSTGPVPIITDFNPKSGPVGTVVTLTGGNFGSAPQVSMPQQGGGMISLPLSSVTSSSLAFVIASGAASGLVMVVNGSVGSSTSSAFTVTASSTFTLTASPAAASLIQGQSVAYAVQVSSTTGFDQLAQLSVTGVPAGVQPRSCRPQSAWGRSRFSRSPRPPTSR